jgi:carbon-monoxide dehydrogenase large subunit
MKFGVGQSVKRTEDIRFVTGQGQYTDDLVFDGEAFACFHRTPHGHAKIVSIDVSAAKAAPGVIDVLTHEDVTAFGAGPMPLMAGVKSKDGSDTRQSPKPVLAADRVTFTGEAVAMVIAETYAQAKDAAELVMVEYETLDAAGTLAAAPTGQQIWESAPGNCAFDWQDGDEAGTEAAFKAAAHAVAVDVVENRVSAMPMETRNAIGVYEPSDDSYILYVTSQGAANIRGGLASRILNIPENKLRVITKDVGGGFGMKGFLYPEQPAVLIGAKKVGRPVRWSAERTESFLADDHGRDMITKGELALDAGGRITALRFTGTANMGGYLSVYAPFIPTLAGSRIFGGVYRIPKAYANIKGYYSNSAPVDAYRGAGRPEAAYLMERLMDAAAAATGLDRAEIRTRNLPAPAELPYANPWGIKYDSGDYPRLLEEGLKRADRDGFAARKAASAKKGLLRGFGFGYYVEITGAAGQEPAAIKFTQNGGVELYCGTQSNGQGHETSFAQLVAEKLGVPYESITVKQGDTNWVNGGGTGGSRSLNMSGGALLASSDEVIRKGKQAAGQVLQAGGHEVAFDIVEGIGTFAVAGTGQTISLGELAVTLKRETLPDFENGLDSDALFKGQAPTFPNGCHVCEVEVDPDTGHVKIDRYTVLDDFGRIINPMLVAGQVHGGIVQGLGQALMENIVYDESSGQLLTASFTDYAMPRASDMPDIDFKYEEILCVTNPLGAKGCGEAGTVGALPAFISAVSDALGVLHIDMPTTPERVWRVLQEKKRAA